MKSGYCNLMHEFILHCIIKLANATQMECNEVGWEQKQAYHKHTVRKILQVLFVVEWSYLDSESYSDPEV